MAKLKAFNTPPGILVQGHLLGYAKMIKILNIYAPYSRRLEFWESIFSSVLLDDRSLIVDGDLNLTLSMDEVWGAGRTKDPSVDFFKAKMEEHKLVDIVRNFFSPTWSNGRCGASGLAK